MAATSTALRCRVGSGTLPSPARAPGACPVCGLRDGIELDAVEHRGVWIELLECPRCRHRGTRTGPGTRPGSLRRVARTARRERDRAA